MRLTPDRQPARTLPMDLTPLVDVVFLLIIFFLTTSSLIEITRAEVALPREEGEDHAGQRPRGIVVNVTRNGTIIVDQQTLSFEELAARLRVEHEQGDEPLDVVVRADQGAALRHVNRIAEHLANLGVVGWRLATEEPR